MNVQKLDYVVDPAESRDTVMESQRELVKAALACRLFNGRLPYCNDLLPYLPPPSTSLVPPELPSTALDPRTGFRRKRTYRSITLLLLGEILITGVARTCAM